MKSENGATKTYLKEDDNILENQNQAKGPKVNLPNGTNLKVVLTSKLPIHKFLSNKAQQGHVLEGLRNPSLLSIGQLCDDDCVAVFTK